MKKTLACTLALTVALAVIPMSTALFASAKTAQVTDWNDLTKYDVYSGAQEETFAKDEDALEATVNGTTNVVKSLYKNLTLADFTAALEIELDANSKTGAGIIFRASEAGNGKDDLCGYVLQVRHAASTRLDLVVYKWGKVDGTYKYMGEVKRLVNEKEGFILPDISERAGTKLVLNLKVEGDTATATCHLKDDPTKVTAELVADLTATTKASGV